MAQGEHGAEAASGKARGKKPGVKGEGKVEVKEEGELVAEGAEDKEEEKEKDLVAVVQLGSYHTRYGAPDDASPKVMRTAVAWRRREDAPPRAAPRVPDGDVDMDEEAGDEDDEFSQTVDRVATESRMMVRRRGGGKPVPWVLRVEELKGSEAVDAEVKAPVEPADLEREGKVVVGDAAVEALSDDRYDVVLPLRCGRIDWGSEATGTMRATLHQLLRAAAQGATSMVLIVPEEATRADVFELAEAAFLVSGVRRVFFHHTSVAAAFGAGLSSCVILDVGHSCGYAVCVEDGTMVADSRVKLPFGGRALQASLARIVRDYADAELCELTEREREDVMVAVKERMCDALSEENDTLSIVTEALRSAKSVRISAGVGIRSTAVQGLFHTALLQPNGEVEEGVFADPEDEESRWMDGLVDDASRSAKAAAARPLGFFPPAMPVATPLGLDRAVMSSVQRAVEARGTEPKSELRRYLSAVLLAGGTTGVLNLGRLLEQRLKHLVDSGWEGVDSKMVDVLVGGKEMDPSELAWKGGAVLAHTESIADFYVTGDEWASRGVRALREKVPFFW